MFQGAASLEIDPTKESGTVVDKEKPIDPTMIDPEWFISDRDQTIAVLNGRQYEFKAGVPQFVFRHAVPTVSAMAGIQGCPKPI